ELIAHLIAHDTADADPAWLCQSLQTRSDIDAVAVNILVVDDDVTDVETDAKLDTPFRRDLGVALGDLPLDVDRAAYRIDDAGKLDEDAVACGLHDAPGVLRDFWIDDRAPVVLECGQRAFLIHAHQPRIACDIPRENGREAALDPFSAQSAPPKGGRHELCLVRFAAVCSGGTRGSTSRGLRDRIEPARGCGVDRRAFKPRRRACIAPSLWQSLHWRPACFLPRGASRLASAAAPARSARPWQASRPPPRRSHRWEAALRRALRRRQAGVRPRRARKSCRRKEGRRASAPACMECPALAGAISATIPATAAEHRA